MADNQIGRNDLCPCGSGKKYKRCHGASARTEQEEVRASLHIHTTPDGKEVPVLGWAPQSAEAWDMILTQLKLAEEHGLLLPMDNPDHWEAVGIDITLTQAVPGLPQWSLRTAPKREDAVGQERPVPAFVAEPGGSLWHREWPVKLTLTEMVRWTEALQAWKSVIIAPYDPETGEFMPFGFQIWLSSGNVVVQPAGQ